MPHTMTRRAVTLNDRKCTLTLENAFWSALAEIAASRGVDTSSLLEGIREEKISDTLSSSARVYVLEFYRMKKRQ